MNNVLYCQRKSILGLYSLMRGTLFGFYKIIVGTNSSSVLLNNTRQTKFSEHAYGSFLQSAVFPCTAIG